MKPKLPPGMYERKGRGFYLRLWDPDKTHKRGGRDRWFALGKDLEEALRRYHQYHIAPPSYAERLTVEAVGKLWLDSYVSVHRSAKGARLAECRVRTYLIPYLGQIQARRVTRDHLRAYRRMLEARVSSHTKRPLSEQTVAHILSDVRCVFKWAEDGGIIDRAPIPKRLLPHVAESPPQFLTPEHQGTVKSLEDPYGFACRVLIGCGPRWSELCRLHSTDVQDGELVIHGPTKTKCMRRVPIPPGLLAELKGRVGKLVPFEAKDSPWFNRSVRLRSGLLEFGSKRCRHSFGVNWVAGRGSLRVLQEMMGHRSIKTTERYMRITQELVREENRRMIGWQADV